MKAFLIIFSTLFSTISIAQISMGDVINGAKKIGAKPSKKELIIIREKQRDSILNVISLQDKRIIGETDKGKSFDNQIINRKNSIVKLKDSIKAINNQNLTKSTNLKKALKLKHAENNPTYKLGDFVKREENNENFQGFYAIDLIKTIEPSRFYTSKNGKIEISYFNKKPILIYEKSTANNLEFEVHYYFNPDGALFAITCLEYNTKNGVKSQYMKFGEPDLDTGELMPFLVLKDKILTPESKCETEIKPTKLNPNYYQGLIAQEIIDFITARGFRLQ